MFEQRYQDTFSRLRAPDALKQEVLNMQNNHKTTGHPRRIALALAAAMLLTVTGLAATWRLWQPKMAELFGASAEAQEALLDRGVTQVLGLSDSDNGITITAEQIIGDENGFFVLFRIDSEDPELLNYMVQPDLRAELDDDIADSVYGTHRRYIRGGQQVWDEEAGHFASMTPMYFYWQAHGEEGVDLTGHTVTFTVEEFDDFTTNGKGVPVWSGHLELTIPLDYQALDTTMYYLADTWVDTPEGPLHITGVEITPISVVVCYEGEASQQLFLTASALGLADGTAVEVVTNGGCAFSLEEGAWRYIMESRTALVFASEPVDLVLTVASDGDPVGNGGWQIKETTEYVIPLAPQ